ncbi:MAG TPA: FKBP-type peptidyl-prolyl cis-trans isomerase [Cyclobacteriaceae bacterium]|jgi:hypothetical protein|nr:hypothetical protein [Cytophagales bacterium]HNP76682.1 FKBP-type peptidyl-prolyl cis-trans isomerase [Cyclobacteriaceae bacterium]
MKISYVMLAVVVLCAACSKSRKSPNGIEVSVVREGVGEYAVTGQYLLLNMLYKDSKDSVWDDTRRRTLPMLYMVPDTAGMKAEKGIENVFRVLKKGDSVIAKVTAKSFFENSMQRELPPEIKPESEITFYFGVQDVIDREKIGDFMQGLRDKQLVADTTAIREYLKKNNINAITDPSGVSYVITNATVGEHPNAMSTVVFRYKGSFLNNNEMFQESTDPVEYPLSNLIRGWQAVFPQFAKGTKATLYIPSSLGYGPNGSPPLIPANANLIFEIELVDFK